MSGNEAIARGAYEAGIRFATAYPGTPSTEILENFCKYDGVYAEWSTNEKVAVEVAKIPMLEPADAAEAKHYIKMAFEISARFDTPVFFRTTTRVSHSKSVVTLEEPAVYEDKTGFVYNAEKYVMVPHCARIRRAEVEKRQQALKEFAETFPENKVEITNAEAGIITAGMPYNYAKEVFPGYSYLKLGMVYPLPEKMIRDFASKVKKLYVIEELDPFLEEQIKAMGIAVTGKEIFPYTS